MIFSKPNTLLYLQRNSLMLAGRRLAAARLDFPDDIVKNLEVLSRSKLMGLCEQFLADHDVHGRNILLVLDGSVMFQKAIELDQSGKPDVLMQGFVDTMPFEPGQRACLAVETGSQLKLFATNADLYGTVVEAIHSANAGKLIAITPGAAYTLGSNDRGITAAAERFFADKTVHKLADFRSVSSI